MRKKKYLHGEIWWIDDLFLTFEMTIDIKLKKKSKWVDFKANIANNEDQATHDTNDDFIESIGMLDNNYSKITGNKVSSNVQDNQQQNPNNSNFQHQGENNETKNSIYSNIQRNPMAWMLNI